MNPANTPHTYPRGRCQGCNGFHFAADRTVIVNGGTWHVACVPADVDVDALLASNAKLRRALTASPILDHDPGCAVASGLACDCNRF